jgi:hypothetical protein
MVKSEELGIFLDDFMDCLNEIEEVFDKSLSGCAKSSKFKSESWLMLKLSLTSLKKPSLY